MLKFGNNFNREASARKYPCDRVFRARALAHIDAVRLQAHIARHLQATGADLHAGRLAVLFGGHGRNCHSRDDCRRRYEFRQELLVICRHESVVSADPYRPQSD